MNLVNEVKNVILSNLKKSSDIKIGIEIENIIYNNKNQRIKVNPGSSFSATDLIKTLKGQKDSFGGYSLEPGGQLEWASKPFLNLHDLENSIREQEKNLKFILKKEKLKIVPFGTDPYFNPNDVELIDQERYKIMDENMQKSGTMGKWMMRCTSSIQVNIDASTERDMEEMVFIADCINPIASYLFSNSPSKNNKLSLEKNFRSIIWSNTDNTRCNNLFDHDIISKDKLLDKYINFFLNTPSIFTFDKESKAVQSERTFGQLLIEERFKGNAKEKVILSYLRQIFTNVRIKNLVEIRGADRTPEGYEIAPAAFWTGLLMESSVRENILNTVLSWGETDRLLLNKAGLSLNINQMGPHNRTYGYWIDYFGCLALKGLVNRNLGEEKLFKGFFDIIRREGPFSLKGQTLD